MRLPTWDEMLRTEAERDEWKRAAEANMGVAEKAADAAGKAADERDEWKSRAEKAERERDCYRASRDFWPLSLREAVGRGDVEACAKDAQRSKAFGLETLKARHAAEARVKRLEVALVDALKLYTQADDSNTYERYRAACAVLEDGHPLADKMTANAGPMGGQPEGNPLTDAQLDGLACQDCSATGQALYEESNHHGGIKRVCADRDACHIRRPG